MGSANYTLTQKPAIIYSDTGGALITNSMKLSGKLVVVGSAAAYLQVSDTTTAATGVQTSAPTANVDGGAMLNASGVTGSQFSVLPTHQTIQHYSAGTQINWIPDVGRAW